jgi:hypothetical protein
MRILVGACIVEVKRYSYPGVVKNVQGNEALIQWDIEGYSLDQTYTQDQFTDGVLPKIGDRFTLHATVREAVERTPLAHEYIERVSDE